MLKKLILILVGKTLCKQDPTCTCHCRAAHGAAGTAPATATRTRPWVLHHWERVWTKPREGKCGCYHPVLRVAAASPEPSCLWGCVGRRAPAAGMPWHQSDQWGLEANRANSQPNGHLLPFPPGQEGSRLFLNQGPRYVTVPNAFSHVKEDGK